MIVRFHLLLTSILFTTIVKSQGVGIGTAIPHASAQLEISSSTKGTLISRMTTAQRNAISNPAIGLLVYDLDKKTLYMYDGNSWKLVLLTSSTGKLPPTLYDSPSSAGFSSFGTSVDISGDYAIVGAPNELPKGSAYIYVNSESGWVQQAKIVPGNSGVNQGAGFGDCVSISGDYVAVGYPTENFGQGSVYTFHRTGSTWTQQARLTASDGTNTDGFAQALSIDGDYLIVGASLDDNTAVNQGSAYVFYRLTNPAGWTTGQPFQAKLIDATGAAGDSFGSSVDIDDGYAIVGSPQKDLTFANQGAAFIFYQFTIATGWTTNQVPQARLTASDAVASMFFGRSVAIDSVHAAIGTSDTAAYAYQRTNPSGWVTNQSHIIKMTPRESGSVFYGHNVAVDRLNILVSDERNVIDEVQAGSVYLFGKTSNIFRIVKKIKDDVPEELSRFGSAIAISGSNVVIGTPLKNNNNGQVAFFKLE